MTTLSDTQRILLSTASIRDGGSVLPLPASLKPGGGIVKALAALFGRGLVEERETSDPAAMRREEDGRRLGLFITAAGLAAIGVETGDEPGSEGAAQAASGPSVPAKVRKTTVVLDLLRRDGGATLDDAARGRADDHQARCGGRRDAGLPHPGGQARVPLPRDHCRHPRGQHPGRGEFDDDHRHRRYPRLLEEAGS